MDMELAACSPRLVEGGQFNPGVELPFGLTTGQVGRTMAEFVDFLGFVNVQLHGRVWPGWKRC